MLKVLKLIDVNIKVDDIYEEEDAEDEETVKCKLISPLVCETHLNVCNVQLSFQRRIYTWIYP